MITFVMLRDARPSLWKTAADDWLTLAKEAEQSATDIYDHGTAPLKENWTDAVGERAGQQLKETAEHYQALAALLRGVTKTLDGLGESIETVQRSLRSAVDYARHFGLVVEETGRVVQQPGVECLEDEPHIAQANLLISEALESATRIDEEARVELVRLTQAAGVSDPEAALDDYYGSAAQNQLDMLRESLPIGEDPATVRRWWDSLTPEQQAELERALPVDLHDLNGIPDDVKQRLRGSDGYDRVEMLRWAQQNWNNSEIDIFDNNCANFVSHALKEAGLDYKMDFWLGSLSEENSWGRGMQTGWDWLDSKDYSHSPSWAQAEAQRDFFLNHGGQEVSVADARPGDIIYWEQAGPDGPSAPGEVHHAAVVTAVTPDGDVLYTQHSSPRLNASLDGRLPPNEVHEGDQRPVIVRPKQTW